MALHRSAETFSKEAVSYRGKIPGEGLRPWPWLFRHADLTHGVENARRVEEEALINTLNHAHFTERPVFVHLRHRKYEESILMHAYPEHCLAGELTCRWSDEHPPGLDLENFQFLHLIIADGKSVILVPARLKEINGNSLKIRLPESSYAVGQRQAKRYACSEVCAEISQSGFYARGELLDFSPIGFRIRVSPEPSCSFHWFNSDELVTVHLRHNSQTLFSGTCSCIREQGNLAHREIVLVPLEKVINRFKKRRISNLRQQLVPSPTVTFNHPLLKRRVQLEVYDISTSGFSVYEEADEGVLMSGMIIPDLTIDFAGALMRRCTAQVIYRREDKERGIRCGLAILDMDINTYSRLSHILSKALDPHAYICNRVDMDALWEFFFRAGFIYPMKYRLIQSHRDNFKETYCKLYQENPEIAKHFTYQKNGRIYGHISMVKAYARTWMIHHYAAGTMQNRRTGLLVLKQMMHYLSDMCRLPSARMDYVMCYFRPENRLPNLMFGGFARALKDPRGCSMDLFAYLPYTSLSLGTELPQGWCLRPCSAAELWELNRFYSHLSGGLLLDALGLKQEDLGGESVEEIYGRLGFMRRCRVYSLTHGGVLSAVLILNQSDLGLNLSELLNSIKVLVTNPDEMPWNVLSTAVAQLTAIYHMDRVPILFYPIEYVQAKEVPYEKQYQCWALDVSCGQDYLDYMQRKFRMGYR